MQTRLRPPGVGIRDVLGRKRIGLFEPPPPASSATLLTPVSDDAWALVSAPVPRTPASTVFLGPHRPTCSPCERPDVYGTTVRSRSSSAATLRRRSTWW